MYTGRPVAIFPISGLWENGTQGPPTELRVLPTMNGDRGGQLVYGVYDVPPGWEPRLVSDCYPEAIDAVSVALELAGWS